MTSSSAAAPRGHTPGPWKFDDEFSIYAAGRRLAIMSGRLNEADAVLMCAAPALLAALRDALEDQHGLGGMRAETMEKARAAIKLATGAP